MTKNEKELVAAMKIVTKALMTDENYFIAWQANIAMSFKDNMYYFKKKIGKRCVSNSDVHRIANTAADSFLEQLTGVAIEDMKWNKKRTEPPLKRNCR